MSLRPETEAEIVRLYFAEHWRVGTISAQLSVHPDAVRRVLGLGACQTPEQRPRPRLVEPFRAFIDETLGRYPTLRATRLHDMLKSRGYPGSVRTLREYVAQVRPSPRREGNSQLECFFREIAHPRPHPTLAPRTVAEVFADERPRLLGLPDPRPSTDLVTPAPVDSQAFVRLDTNRYSVPSAFVGKTLTLVASDHTLRLVDGATEIARHPRSFARRQVFEDPAHRAAIVKERRAASDLKGRDRLSSVAPQFHALLERWTDSGINLSSHVTRAIQILDLYGDEIFTAAVTEIVNRGLRDVGALAVACDRLRRDRNRPVPMEVRLPSHVVDRDVVPHSLESYDER